MTEARRDAAAPHVYRAERELPAQAAALLHKRRTAVLGTPNRDGSVHMTPVWFYFEEGRLYVETNSATRKARNVERAATASLLLRGKADDGSPVVALATGAARLIRGAAAGPIFTRLRAKYLSERGRGPVGRYLDGIDDVVIEILAERWSSWRGALMNDELRSLPEYDDGAWDEWFLPDD